MIQRIQSVWLLLAALCNAGLFFFDIYRAHVLVNGADTLQSIRVNDHYPMLLVALVITAMPAIAIFLFKNRKRQRLMAILAMVFTAGFISQALMRVSNFNNQVPAPTNGSYWIGAVLPAIAIIFLGMAIGGINKDMKLVKSLDRLR